PGHQVPGEAEPPPEQASVTAEREEQVGRVGARDEARGAGEGPVDDAGLLAGAGGDAGCGHGCGVVSWTDSSRATASAGATRRRTASSMTGWASMRIGRMGPTHEGATT